MKSEYIEARACPFCKSALNLRIIADDESWRVACLECHAQGPDAEGPVDAIIKWNGDNLEGVEYEN